MLKAKHTFLKLWGFLADYQRNSTHTLELTSATSLNKSITQHHFIPTVKQPSCDINADCKTLLQKLKISIQRDYNKKSIANKILLAQSLATMILNVLLITLYPIITHSVELYLMWVIIELILSIIVTVNAYRSSEIKDTSNLDQLKRISILYIVLCGLIVLGIMLVLTISGVSAIIGSIREMKAMNDKDALFSCGELAFIACGSLRLTNLIIVIVYQQKLFRVCKKYNITEFLNFTKRKMEKL